MRLVILALIAPFVLAGCLSMPGDTSDYQREQAGSYAAQAEARERAALAVLQSLPQSVRVRGSTGVDFELDVDFTAAFAAVNGFFTPSRQVEIREGYTGAMMLKDIFIGGFQMAPLGLMASALKSLSPSVNVTGGGNALDLSQTRDYRLASGDGSRIDSGDDNRENTDNEQWADSRSEYSNDNRANTNNEQWADSRTDYQNDSRTDYQNATADPTIMEPTVYPVPSTIVPTQIVETNTASPFVYNESPVEAQ